MNSFGLGLVLNFVDNASSGMNSATRTFMQMSAVADEMTSAVSASAVEMTSVAYALGAVGDTFIQAGSSIIGVFTGLSEQVINAGMSMQGYRMQLSALYDSVEAGEQKIEEIKQYAMSSVFDIQSLIPAITMMKAVGIEAMDEVTTSSGNATQRLLDYASDIAAMIPNIRTAYGTGVQGAMGAIKEYIAEGNELTLRRGAGLDITGILGVEKGSTIAERTQQVADLVEQLGILGYASSLAGTPTQRLSNIQDALFNTLTEIADSGVFDSYCNLLERLSDWLFSVVENEESFNTITGILGDTITTLLSPLSSLLDWIISISDSLIDWMNIHPVLTKYILLTVAAIGGLLVASGALLRGFSTLGLALIAFREIKNVIPLVSGLGSAMMSLVAKALPLVALAGLLYWAWKENLFGIRDTLTQVFSDIGAIISIAFDALADNTLSEDQWVRMNDLGIRPFIESLLMLKYYWGFFVDGFKAGFKGFFEGISESAEGLQLMGIDITSLAASFGEFLSSLLEAGSEDKWEAVGNVVGKIAAGLLSLLVVGNAVKGVVSIFSGLLKVFGAVAKVGGAVSGVFKFLFSPILSVGTKVLGVLKNFGAALSLLKQGFSVFDVFGAWFTKLAPIISKIGSIFLKFGGTIVSFVTTTLWPALQTVGTAIAGGVSAIAAALGLPVAAVVAIIAAIVALVAVIVIFRDEIANFFVTLWDSIVNSPFGQTVAQIFSSVVKVVVAFVKSAVTVVVSFFKMIWTIIQGIAKVVAGVFNVVVAIVRNAIKIVVSIFRLLYEAVRVIVLAVALVFKTIFDFVYQNIIKPFVDLVSTLFNWVKDNVFTPVAEFFKSVWESAVAFVTPIITSVGDFFQGVADKIVSAFTAVQDFFVGVFDFISGVAGDFFDWVSEKLGWIVDSIDAVGSFFSGGINKAGDFLSGVGDKLASMVGLSTGGYVKTTGIAVLHPNEVVVNDTLTKRLGLFLDDYQERPTAQSNQRTTPVVVSTSDDQDPEEFDPTGVNFPVPSPQPVAVAHTTSPQPSVQNDYSVTFMAGSVVIQLANATDAELERAADKLMKIIERKQQLKQMAARK